MPKPAQPLPLTGLIVDPEERGREFPKTVGTYQSKSLHGAKDQKSLTKKLIVMDLHVCTVHQ